MTSNPDDTLPIFRIDCPPMAVPAARVQSAVMPPQQPTQPPGSSTTRPGIFRHALWEIAKQYTDNTYKYPELARQGGIRNPLRIYPGNKVHIIVR